MLENKRISVDVPTVLGVLQRTLGIEKAEASRLLPKLLPKLESFREMSPGITRSCIKH